MNNIILLLTMYFIFKVDKVQSSVLQEEFWMDGSATVWTYLIPLNWTFKTVIFLMCILQLKEKKKQTKLRYRD